MISYIDQRGPRNLWISKNLNPDFKDQYEQLEKTEANRERRQRLASGKTNANFSQTAPQDDLSDEDDLSLDEPCEEDFEETDPNEFMDTSMAHATPEVSYCPSTRSSSRLSTSRPLFAKATVATQTEALRLDEVDFPLISTIFAS